MKNPNIWRRDSIEDEKSENKKIISRIGEDLIKVQDSIRALGYEERTEQNDIMWDIIDALEDKSNYLIEAGVGIGKSFAYLIPGILLSRYTGKPLVVATSSIHLTEQLANDIKDVQKILEQHIEYEKIDTVVGKGRTHYPCAHKIESLIQKHIEENNDKYVKKYEEILGKVKNGADRQNKMGIEEVYWEEITKHTCEKDLLFKKDDCPLYKMRNDLKTSQEYSFPRNKDNLDLYRPKVLIVNHDLLIAHFKKMNETRYGILPTIFSMLIIDEVHNLEDKARNSLTASIDQPFINKTFKDLNKFYSRLRNVNRRKGIIRLMDMINNLFKDINKQLIDDIKDLNYDGDADNLFIKSPNSKYKGLPDDISDLITNIDLDITSQPSISQALENESELISDNLNIISKFVVSCFENPHNNIVWGQLYNKENFRVYLCPDEVSEFLNHFIFRRDFLTIGLSATITVLKNNNKKSYDYTKRSIGFEGNEVEPKPSPFPYEKSRLFVPLDLPDYNQRNKAYFESIGEVIFKITKNSIGGSLVLFTSKKDLNEVYKVLSTKVEQSIYRGMKSEKTNNILEKFKQDKGIILGTGTFWEGLDLKGELLTNLIVVRLPFPVPSPILKRKEDKSSFEEVFVPEMITKLRQGTGRLIRTKTDIGVCSILDSRMNQYNNQNNKRKEIIYNSLPFKNIVKDYEELALFQKENNL